MPWGYDPLQFAQLKTDILNRGMTNVSNAAAGVAQGVTSAVSGIVQGQKADELQLSQANQAYNDFLKLLRTAQKYVPEVADDFSKQGMSDPVEKFAPPSKKGELTGYLDTVAKLNTSLAYTLANDPRVDKTTIDKIVGMPGWSDQARAAMAKRQGVLGAEQKEREQTAKYQAAGQAVLGISGQQEPMAGGGTGAPTAEPPSQIGPDWMQTYGGNVQGAAQPQGPAPTGGGGAEVPLTEHLTPPQTQFGAQQPTVRPQTTQIGTYGGVLSQVGMEDVARTAAGFVGAEAERARKTEASEGALEQKAADRAQRAKDKALDRVMKANQFKNSLSKRGRQGTEKKIGELLNTIHEAAQDEYRVSTDLQKLEDKMMERDLLATNEERSKMMNQQATAQVRLKEAAVYGDNLSAITKWIGSSDSILDQLDPYEIDLLTAAARAAAGRGETFDPGQVAIQAGYVVAPGVAVPNTPPAPNPRVQQPSVPAVPATTSGTTGKYKWTVINPQ